MCELLAVSSDPATRLTLSLSALASHSAPASGTRDGWGVAYYQGKDVALFREPGAADDSPLVRLLERNGPCTSLAISHIRHATQGEVSLANTQPFVREFAGTTHVFAHNGDLPGIRQCKVGPQDRYQPVGTTDSEHAFCVLLERLRAAVGLSTPQPPLRRRLEVIAAFAAELRRLGPANFLYADGDTLFAHGHRRIQRATGRVTPPGLHVLARQCPRSTESIEGHGAAVAAGFQHVVLIASVPLTDEAWRPLAEGEIVAVSAGQLHCTTAISTIPMT